MTAEIGLLLLQLAALGTIVVPWWIICQLTGQSAFGKAHVENEYSRFAVLAVALFWVILIAFGFKLAGLDGITVLLGIAAILAAIWAVGRWMFDRVVNRPTDQHATIRYYFAEFLVQFPIHIVEGMDT